MPSVLSTALESVLGALDRCSRDGATTFYLSPKIGRETLGDASFELSSSIPSGVRIAMTTDAPFIEVEAHLTRLVISGNSP
ncbi:hypothetical protein [Arthrobacter sp. SD76]|uniref:hypothetical protein n=1 Tax=Arthrobacter sp. SD76 TaxID=3415007 RepID=UPI003C75B82E